MIVAGLQIAAALYLAAGLVAWLGVVLAARRASRAASWLLAAGALVHGITFLGFHWEPSPPPLTDLATAISFMAWVAAVALLAFLRRTRLTALVGLVAPAAFVGTFFAALRTPHSPTEPLVGAASSWPHLHVVLSSMGLALLGIACVAAIAFLAVDRALKQRRPVRSLWPSLEALDRVNRVALALGFLLLSLGVATGMLWVESESHTLWTGTAHETWSVLAWVVYAVLFGVRFAGRQRGRRAAVAAIAGFAFLLFAVVGVGLFA